MLRNQGSVEISAKGKSAGHWSKNMISSCYWFPLFLGHPVEKEYRDDGRVSSTIRIPHPRMIVRRHYRTQIRARHTHTGLGCVGRRTRHYKVACHGSMDLASGQSRGLLHFLASRNFLLVPLVRSRENRERRGVLEIAASRARHLFEDDARWAKMSL